MHRDRAVWQVPVEVVVEVPYYVEKKVEVSAHGSPC